MSKTKNIKKYNPTYSETKDELIKNISLKIQRLFYSSNIYSLPIETLKEIDKELNNIIKVL